MTKQEVKTKIAAAAETEWYKNVQTSFNFPYIGISLTLQGFSAIYEYIDKHVTGWSKYADLPSELQRSKQYYTGIRNELNNFLSSYINENTPYLNQRWRDMGQIIGNVNQKPIPSDSPFADFLLDIHKTKPDQFTGAYKYVIKSTDYNINNIATIAGTLAAYEFEMKDQSGLVNRRDAEKKSIAQIRNDFDKYLSESETQVISHLKNLSEKYEQYVLHIDTLKQQKEELFQKWFEHTKDEQWKKWIEPTMKTVLDLEATYQQKLKLEEPALYWQNRAKKLSRHGWIAMVVLIGLIAVTAWSLGKILWNSPEQIYTSFFSGDKSAAIRWSIVYITLISFIAFCVKAVSKVMFSSFHLARDCEERYTLTYFYLSLLKNSKVDEKDRQLIMQSLFSRAETGLLKDDSSPTMPSDMISKFVSK